MDINFPLQVKLFDTDNNLVEETELLKHDISFFKDVFAIQKSGTYTIEIIDFT
ncbi:hypothetical protein HOG21_01995 [bacterium]|nr:hypothetical protein [bacterium]